MDNACVAPKLMSFQLLEEITNGFSKDRKVGAGSYGNVYKGERTNGEVIAVKLLHYIPGLDDEQFEKEYHNLASLQHKNIVRLLGYCHETRRKVLPYNGKMVFAEMTQRALCFEYMQNGSLESCLTDETSGHDWHTRYSIIKGICQGLKYLHEELKPPMYHLDLKPANVLLDVNLVPKIADFGLSRLFGGEQTKMTRSSVGTFGYLPPEYIDATIISIKFDIFSLGVIIIKILMGPRCYFRSAEMSTQQFVELVYRSWKEKLQKTSVHALEPYLKQIKRCTEIALRCMDADRHKRPSIGVIIDKLNEMETAIQLLGASMNDIGSSMYKDTLSEFGNDDIDRSTRISPSEEDHRKSRGTGKYLDIDDDNRLARSIEESLKIKCPPRDHESSSHPCSQDNDKTNNICSYQPSQTMYSVGFRTCARCHSEISRGRFLTCMEVFWHPECFCCRACSQTIYQYEFAVSENHPYHITCYKERFHPKCDVCKEFIPLNMNGLIEYRKHPFWLQKYCPSHEVDGTPRCCSCERMEPRESRYVLLDDGRKLCVECLDSAVMDTNECQPLYLEIQKFYERLGMKAEQQVPLFLVERQALNKDMEGDKTGYHLLPETRGLCLLEEQTVSTILRKPIMAGKKIMKMITGTHRMARRYEVTSIIILCGLPRLLTGSILAHEMMRLWLDLKGYHKLRPDIQEGICRVLSHLWIKSEIMVGSGRNAASASSSSLSSTSSEKGVRSQFERKLGDFFLHQIEMDTSVAYGEGFRAGNRAVQQYGLKRTLEHIGLTGTLPIENAGD